MQSGGIMVSTPIVVIAGLISNNCKYLIAKRNLSKSLGGLWEFPGGKLADDETSQECLKRELMEELNIDADIGGYICKNTHEYNDFTIELHLYEVNSFSGEVIQTEHEEIQWVAMNDFDDYEFAPADIPLINKLQEVWN